MRGADFTSAFGFTSAQLYSTASYQGRDLRDINLGHLDLSGWNFSQQDLANAKFDYARLGGADFNHADLTKAVFETGVLTGTDFTDSDVRGADFYFVIGFNAEQLYSTASYKSRDLSGVSLSRNNLTGWDFTGQNLTHANFDRAVLNNTILTNANVSGATFSSTTYNGLTAAQLYSTASYQNRDLRDINLGHLDLSGWNFTGQNLTNAKFNSSTLTETTFDQAEISGANFVGTVRFGFTASQLYSTASYQKHDLSGIGLLQNDLTGWNFAGQKLANASFFSAMLTNADFSGADSRGAMGLNADVPLNQNLIRPDGHIKGLQLSESRSLVVRNNSGDASRQLAPIPILVEQGLRMDSTGALQMLFDADPWHSLISFASATPVLLGGTLELNFATDVDPASQIGRTIRIFDWSGVSPEGKFNVVSPYL